MLTHMELDLDIAWKRYGLISELAHRFDADKNQLGKTALQKMIFLLQHSFGVDCDYNYILYTYGPYSSDVARDLDVVTGLNGTSVQLEGLFGYNILPGTSNEDLRKRASAFLSEIEPKLNQLVADFGTFSAKELELRSTSIYLSKPGMDRATLIQRVHEVKPHFSKAQIDTAIKELEAKDYIGGGISSVAAE